MASNGTWIDHFPDNFSWSNAPLGCKGMAAWGALALEEIDHIGEQLNSKGNARIRRMHERKEPR